MVKKILLIDDDKDITNILSILLSPIFEIKACNTLLEGFNTLKNYKADLILLDVNLPDGYGTSFIKRIKDHDSEMKIVLISAENHFLAEEYKDYGADFFLKKPFAKGDLIDAIDRTLSNTHKN